MLSVDLCNREGNKPGLAGAACGGTGGTVGMAVGVGAGGGGGASAAAAGASAAGEGAALAAAAEEREVNKDKYSKGLMIWKTHILLTQSCHNTIKIVNLYPFRLGSKLHSYSSNV